MHQSSFQEEPFGIVPFSPFQTLHLKMSRRYADCPSSPANRQMIERTYSRGYPTPVSAGNGFTTHTTDSARDRTSHKRTRSDSTSSNLDRSKPQDIRKTWPAGQSAIVQKTSSSSHRSPSTSGRNQSQTDLRLHRSASNSSTAPSLLQWSHSNHSTPTLSKRQSRTSHYSPTHSRSSPILFYHKHEPHYGFTNFSNHAVKYDSKVYPTSEHLFQSLKFAHRPLLAEHIRTCDSRPSMAFSEARRFQPEVRKDWSTFNIKAMNVTLYHKFTQHGSLREELLATGDAELIENSDKDSFWGCGPDGRGKNELGKALVRLRSELRG